MITREQIQHLYDQYLELVRIEVQEFGVKPPLPSIPGLSLGRQKHGPEIGNQLQILR